MCRGMHERFTASYRTGYHWPAWQRAGAVCTGDRQYWNTGRKIYRMDRMPPSIDFAVIGHQDNWQNISSLINGIRTGRMGNLEKEAIRNIYSFIPPRDIFRINVKSTNGNEINGVYIETFIDPDSLQAGCQRTNINKVKNAVIFANKLGAKVVTLGGFCSIVLEGNLQGLREGGTVYTTGNTLTSAYIVKAT